MMTLIFIARWMSCLPDTLIIESCFCGFFFPLLTAGFLSFLSFPVSKLSYF